MVKEHLISLNKFKSPVPDELHPRVIKELVEELSEPLSIIFAESGRQVKCRTTGGELTLSLSSKRAKRRNLGTTDQSVCTDQSNLQTSPI